LNGLAVKLKRLFILLFTYCHGIFLAKLLPAFLHDLIPVMGKWRESLFKQ
jgi:hypothetical protein